jgi:hypothetical protein
MLEYRDLFIVMLNPVMLSVIIPNIVIMSAVMLNVLAPIENIFFPRFDLTCFMLCVCADTLIFDLKVCLVLWEQFLD